MKQTDKKSFFNLLKRAIRPKPKKEEPVFGSAEDLQPKESPNEEPKEEDK